MVMRTIRNRRPALLLLLALLTASLLFMAAPAAAVSAKGALVVDLGDFFTTAQESQLTQQAAALGAQYQMDIVIVTTRSTGGKSSRAYADDYFDNNGYGVGADRDGILFLLDYENRQAYISTSGSGIRYMTDQRINQTLDAVKNAGLSSGRNYEAAQAFLTQTAGFLQAGIPANQYSQAERTRSVTFVDVLIALLTAGITALIFHFSTRYAYKGHPRPNVFEFRGNSIVDLGIAADSLINTFVATRHIPPPSSGGSSGRSSTHTSSSGRTHGGGGRGF